MNVTAHPKERNEEMRMSKRKAGKERKQATNFKEAVCCPSVVVQGAAQQKNIWGVPGVTGTLGKANSHFNRAQTRSGTATPH